MGRQNGKPSPLMGEGWVGVTAPGAAALQMKKYPMGGAHERARALRREMTEAETKLWRMLRSRQIEGYRFRRQVPLGRYIADFVCHEARLIVELDGGQHDFCRSRKRTGTGSCKAKAIGSYASGMMKSWK